MVNNLLFIETMSSKEVSYTSSFPLSRKQAVRGKQLFENYLSIPKNQREKHGL